MKELSLPLVVVGLSKPRLFSVTTFDFHSSSDLPRKHSPQKFRRTTDKIGDQFGGLKQQTEGLIVSAHACIASCLSLLPEKQVDTTDSQTQGSQTQRDQFGFEDFRQHSKFLGQQRRGCRLYSSALHSVSWLQSWVASFGTSQRCRAISCNLPLFGLLHYGLFVKFFCTTERWHLVVLARCCARSLSCDVFFVGHSRRALLCTRLKKSRFWCHYEPDN